MVTADGWLLAGLSLTLPVLYTRRPNQWQLASCRRVGRCAGPANEGYRKPP